VETAASRIEQFTGMSIRPMVVKFAQAVYICLCVIPFAAAACTGPQALEAKLHVHPDASMYSDLGSWFGDRHQYSCAIESFQAALRLEPGSSRLLYLLGLTFYSAGSPEQAIAPLQQSIRLIPEVLKPHLILGFALAQLHRNEDAKAQWEAVLQIDPHSAVALDGLARSLIAEKDYFSAIGVLRSAPRDQNLTLDLAEAYDRAGMHDDAGDILTRAVSLNPSSLRLRNALVGVLVRQTHFEGATKVAEKSVRLHPRDIEAQILYLHVLVLNDDVAVARPLAAKLLVAAPHDFGVLYLNGVLEREAGQYSAARNHLEQAVALDPNYYNARYNLGVVLAQLKDAEGAKEQLEKALALGAEEPQVRFELASVLRTLGESEQAQEQLKLYQKEAQAKSNRTLAASKAAQGDKELATGDPHKATDYYREAAEAYPEDAMLSYKLSVALDRMGDVAAERKALEQAVHLDPNFALAQNQLGYLASQSGDTAAAEEHFRQAVRAAPNYAQAWVSLAATLGMESRFPEAQEALASALRLDPQNAEALQLRKDLTAAQAQR
jgi:tetratricopeptide (TPR) repeat protein